MFDDGERTTLLMLLWNWKQEVEGAISSGRMPADQVEAARRNLSRNDGIVKKLGGDPSKAAFGL